MSGSGGVSITRNRGGGENRFYNPPPMRKQQQQQQQQTAAKTPRREEKPSIPKSSPEKRTDREECATSSPSPSPSSLNNGSEDKNNNKTDDNSTNFDRFLEYTTPVVPVQYFPKTGIRGWRGKEQELKLHSPPFFVLDDLWESLKEWSAYGAGVPLLLNGTDSVIQYYVPYLSGIQLYVDPLRPSARPSRRHAEESDAESSRETSSDGSNSECGIGRTANNDVQGARSQPKIGDSNIQRLSRLSLSNGSFGGSSSDESDSSNPHGQLVFEYLEHEQPFSREPLADKIAVLAVQFPSLKTYRSCDLSPSSWISVAWYPIYRIPMGPTLQNLDACFLTYHSLSTLSSGAGMDGSPFRGFKVREFHGANTSLKMPLITFGLAFYKFKVSFWNPDEVDESQKANSLVQAADNWLRLLQVNHPDFKFFVSHNTYRR